MNRAQAKLDLTSEADREYECASKVAHQDAVIDKLCDTFESEYKTLKYAYDNERYWRSHYESKCGVCGTCKYFHDGKYPDDRYCDKDISMMEEFSILDKHFGCNLWEKK